MKWPGILMILLAVPLLAQDDMQVVDLLEGLETEEIGQTDFLQLLQDLQDDPVNVNTATVRELLRIPFLDEGLARQLVQHRNRQGPFVQEVDLLQVPGFSAELLDALRPYIRFRSPPALPTVDYRSQVGRNLHQVRGFSEGAYQNRWALYHRLRLRPRPEVTATAIWEKDAGEENWFDFGSFSLSYRWEPANSYLHIGDYDLETGQRLVFSGAYGAPLVVNSPAPFRRAPLRWQPKSSVDENAFFRGALWEVDLSPGTNLLLAYSRHNLDATLSDDGAIVTSFFSSGLHRTDSEQLKKHRVSETAWMGIIRRQWGEVQTGLQVARFRYSRPVRLEMGDLTAGPTYLSGFYAGRTSLLDLRGEAAVRDGKFPALQQSVLLHLPDPRFRYGAVVYYYHPRFWSFHGRALGQVSQSPANELGLMVSATAGIFSTTEVSAYAFIQRPAHASNEFSFLKRTQQVQIMQKLGRTILSARLTRRIRRQTDAATGFQPLAQGERVSHILRVHLQSPLAPMLQLQHRVEISRANPSSNRNRRYGVALYQDVRYRPWQHLSLQFRWTQFDIPDFDYRLYEFENDLPGNFRNILLNGRGFKWFFLAIYEFARKWRFSVKYRHMVFPDENQLGSGRDTVLGNQKRELRMQLQVLY